LRLEGLVDGVNRRVSNDVLTKNYAPARAAYAAVKAPDRLAIADDKLKDVKPATWLLGQLKGK
jgi:hypothetical protein